MPFDTIQKIFITNIPLAVSSKTKITDHIADRNYFLPSGSVLEDRETVKFVGKKVQAGSLIQKFSFPFMLNTMHA